MAIPVSKVELHWNYFLTIEHDLERLSRFVEFDEKNFKCFSIEIARLLLAAAAETDIVCKQICTHLNPGSTASDITRYKTEILKHYSKIPQFVETLPRYGLKLKPWSNWSNTNNYPPLWWTAHNKIKHQRHEEFHKGNLKNALNSVAGLFVMVLYLYKEKAELGELLPNAQLLRVRETNFRGATAGGFETGVMYFESLTIRSTGRAQRWQRAPVS